MESDLTGRVPIHFFVCWWWYAINLQGLDEDGGGSDRIEGDKNPDEEELRIARSNWTEWTDKTEV